MKTTTLRTSSNYYNPNFYNGKKIEKVYIFDKTGILFESCTRWFGFSNNEYKVTILPFHVKNKIKIDFTYKGSFFIKDSIYINVSDCKSEVYLLPVSSITNKYIETTQKCIDIDFQGVEKRTGETVNKISSFKSFHIKEKTELQKKLEIFCNENSIDISLAKQVLETNEVYKKLIKHF